MVHELKTWPPVFQHVVDGIKTFEYRRDDRNFAVGDILRLREWSLSSFSYSGREVAVEVVYRVDGGQFGIPAEYCILGVRLAPQAEAGQHPATAEVPPPDGGAHST